jgi:hypothetical protein
MLLNALMSPEAEKVVHETSAYLTRAPGAAGTFMWGVFAFAAIIFVGAIVSSMRVSAEPPK